ncbi:hypothetical protein K1719_035559 [Acacia pycnantha]|nr:hypothetical protein K1719_035559 [Acacia pycnantha]
MGGGAVMGTEEDRVGSKENILVVGSLFLAAAVGQHAVVIRCREVRGDRQPVSISYREKLLSLGGLGFLMSHEEADDIVSGWKGFFAKQHVGLETEVGGDEEAGCDDDMGVAFGSRYPILIMTLEQYTSWCKPWMNSLIIKVLGLSVPKHVLIDRVHRMWKPKQPMKVVPLSHEYYIVSFSSKEDHDYAYYEGPWMIDDHYLLVQRWRPNFNPRKADGQRKEKCPLQNEVVGNCLQDKNKGKPREKVSEHVEGSQVGLSEDTVVGNVAGQGTGDDVGQRKLQSMMGTEVTVEPQTTVEQASTTTSGTSGGINYLGPQMVFSRDVRCSFDGPQGSASSLQVVRKSTSGILGTSNKAVGDTEKKKSEWIVVGSKRKKEDGPKVFGKENKQRPKPKGKVLSKLEAHKLEMKNSFTSLQEQHVLGTMQNHESKDVLDRTLSACLQVPIPYVEASIEDVAIEGVHVGPVEVHLEKNVEGNYLGNGL